MRRTPIHYGFISFHEVPERLREKSSDKRTEISPTYIRYPNKSFLLRKIRIVNKTLTVAIFFSKFSMEGVISKGNSKGMYNFLSSSFSRNKKKWFCKQH